MGSSQVVVSPVLIVEFIGNAINWIVRPGTSIDDSLLVRQVLRTVAYGIPCPVRPGLLWRAVAQHGTGHDMLQKRRDRLPEWWSAL